jgi:predicted nucleotidyltransferase
MPEKFSSSVRVYYPKIKREELIELLKDGLSRLGPMLKIKKVFLFGSYATNRYTVASDIDLFIITNEKISKDIAYNELVKKMGIRRLEPHIVKESEYQILKKAGSMWIRRVENEGILVYAKNKESTRCPGCRKIRKLYID